MAEQKMGIQVVPSVELLRFFAFDLSFIVLFDALHQATPTVAVSPWHFNDEKSVNEVTELTRRK